MNCQHSTPAGRGRMAACPPAGCFAAALAACLLAAALAGCGPSGGILGSEPAGDPPAASSSPALGQPPVVRAESRPEGGFLPEVPENKPFASLEEMLADPQYYAKYDEMALKMSGEKDYTIYPDGDELVIHFVWQTGEDVDLDWLSEYVQASMERNIPGVIMQVELIRSSVELESPRLRILIETQDGDEIYNVAFAPDPNSSTLPSTSSAP